MDYFSAIGHLVLRYRATANVGQIDMVQSQKHTRKVVFPARFSKDCSSRALWDLEELRWNDVRVEVYIRSTDFELKSVSFVLYTSNKF